jgi:hypothetical protein
MERRSNARVSGASGYIATTKACMERRSNARVSGASGCIATTEAYLEPLEVPAFAAGLLHMIVM